MKTNKITKKKKFYPFFNLFEGIYKIVLKLRLLKFLISKIK